MFTTALRQAKSCGCARACPPSCTCAKHKSRKCPVGCTCARHSFSRWPAHPSGGRDVGEILDNGRELIEYCGKQNVSHLWKWKCPCGRINGPSDFHSVKSGTHCLHGCFSGNNIYNWAGHEGFTGSFLCNLQKHVQRGNRTLSWFPDLTIGEVSQYLWELWENQGGRCALSGRELKLPQSNKDRKNASLDRIDSSQGYEVGNVQWTDPLINRMKRDWPETQFFQMCAEVFLHQNARAQQGARP